MAPFAGNNRTPSVQGDSSEGTRNELWIFLGLKSQLIPRNPEIPYGAAMALHYVLNLPPLSIFSPLVSHFGIFTQSPRIFLNSVSEFFLAPEYPLSISYPSPLLYCVCESSSCVWLFATSLTVAHQAPLSMGFFQARILEWVAISLSRGIFLTQGLNPGLSHCRQTLYRLSHRGSPLSLLAILHSFFKI